MNMLLESIASNGNLSDIFESSEKTAEKANELIDSIKGFFPKLINFGINVLIALAIFWIGKFIIALIMKICKNFFNKTKVEISVSKFLLSLIRAVCYIILVIIVLDTVGIKTTSFIALLGTASLAAGLSIQGSLANFAGGILILVLKPFKVGDYIVESSGANEGTVSKIDIFYTTLITADNKKIVIPNGNLSNASLVNISALETRRIEFQIGISYTSDIVKAKKIMEDIAINHNLVLKDHEIFAFVSSLDASQVTIGLRVWTNVEDYWTVKFDLNESIKIALDENGIEIPFNQLVVHMASDDEQNNSN